MICNDGWSLYKILQLLSQVLDDLEPQDRDPDAPFRMPIIDKYKDMGTVVMGKSESGTVKVGGSLLVMPNRLDPQKFIYVLLCFLALYVRG